jgi:ubiquinone/menaquinone biosynthesis C-methylase UbiE
MDKYEITIDTYNKSAQQYQDKFMEMDLYNETYDKFCKYIELRNAEILEIACGPGNITKYLLSKKTDFKIFGIDLSPKMIELARINIPTAKFEVMDCRDIGLINNLFDAIMCGFCLPYLSKEEAVKLIKDSSMLLKPNGMLYISTMEDDYSKSGFETTSFSGQNQIFIHYHEWEYLTKALSDNGFTILDIERKDYPESNGTFTTDLIIIARK